MDDMDWPAAKAHFDSMQDVYRAMIGWPGVNTSLALALVFQPLQQRYDSGERTPELYAAMLAVE